MSRATWSPEDQAWLDANPHGLPPEPFPYQHAHQRWANAGPKDSRGQPDPWMATSRERGHNGASRTLLALLWLRRTFGGRS